MRGNKWLLGILCGTFLALVSCKRTQKESEKNPAYLQAFELHQKSRELYKAVASLRDSFQSKIDPQDLVMHQDVALLDSLTTHWVETFTEVPGFQDYMEHHSDHQHGPSLIKDLKDSQVVKIQQIHYQELKELEKGWEELLKMPEGIRN